jgi:hypothetical protein
MILTICAIALTIDTILKFLKINNEINEYKKIDKEMKSNWKRTKAKILSLGINVDYDFPELEPDLNDIEEKDIELVKNTFFDKQRERMIVKDLYDGILISYGYVYDEKKYKGRDVGLLKEESDLSLIYKLNKGDIVSLWVNPKDPFESFLRCSSEKSFLRQKIYQSKQLLPVFSLSVFLWFLSVLSIFN